MSALRYGRLALRGLFRQPGFTLTVVGMPGVAIGANTAIFSLIDGGPHVIDHAAQTPPRSRDRA